MNELYFRRLNYVMSSSTMLTVLTL